MCAFEAELCSPAALAHLHDAVMAACDGNDGVKDGVQSARAVMRRPFESLACR